METKPVVKKRTYMTKKRKTQFLYWKVLLGVFMLATIVIGGSQVFTEKHVEKMGVITIVKAETIPEVEPEPIEDMIRRLADEANFQWPDYLVRLAKCESSLNPDAVGTIGNKPKGSRDRGLFQINSYWNHQISDEQAFDAEWSTKWTMDQINKGFQSRWTCDRKI